jgi:thiosulfate dehydrogenase
MKRLSVYLSILVSLILSACFITCKTKPKEASADKTKTAEEWTAPAIDTLTGPKAELVRYGRDLIAFTANYLGPKGSVAAMSNGLNCQNCHLDAGTKLFANSFAAVAATYPKFRNRSGKVESLEFRINECMERSMNGKKLDSLSHEMRAMVAYINWVGKDVSKEKLPKGWATEELPFLSRQADTLAGRSVFKSRCSSCHGLQGAGFLKPDSAGYLYPPLWGPGSFNVSAGMYRLSKMAGFVKHNMPFKSAENTTPLTNEEAWDVSAYIISQQRPQKFFKYDWPDITTKPPDYPFGPFSDSFSAAQHKYGPFTAMVKKKGTP